MALNYVTLTLDLYDGSGNYPVSGTASFVPSAVLTDAGVQITDQQPVVASFRAGSLPSARLLATDNSGPLPAGWTWGVTFGGITGAPAPFSFFLPYADGANQVLSSQIPVSSGAAFQAYMPLSGGQFTGPVEPAAVSTADGATITIDAALGNLFRVTIAGNRTLDIINGTDGQLIRVEVTQGPGGPWSLTYSPVFDFGAASPPVLSTAAGAEDDFGLGYKAATSKWKCLAFAPGY